MHIACVLNHHLMDMPLVVRIAPGALYCTGNDATFVSGLGTNASLVRLRDDDVFLCCSHKSSRSVAVHDGRQYLGR